MSITSPILIMGAGISGLALGQGLLEAKIPFKIFERDPALNVRSQGYRVRINDTGINALNQLLTPELFERLRKCCAILTSNVAHPTMRLNALTGEELQFMFRGPPPQVSGDTEPLCADRSVLRSVLIKGLESHVTFGKEFKEYKSTPSGVLVQFADGSSEEGSILIGSDGIKSRVRKQLIPENYILDTTARVFYGKTTLTPELLEHFNKDAAKGMTLVQDLSQDIPVTLLLEPIHFRDNEYRHELPADYVYWVFGSKSSRFGMTDAELFKLTPEEIVAETLKQTANWHPSFHALFKLQDKDQTSILRVDSSRPEIPVWETQKCVTLIGDAAHAMAPTAAVGSATALRSAAALAKVLIEEGITVEGLKKYEDEMRGYAGEAITNSNFGGKALFKMPNFKDMEPTGA